MRRLCLFLDASARAVVVLDYLATWTRVAFSWARYTCVINIFNGQSWQRYCGTMGFLSLLFSLSLYFLFCCT